MTTFPFARILGGFSMVAFCAVFALHLMSCGGSSLPTATGELSGPPKALTPAEVSAYLENPEKLFFLDVREDEEIKESGSITGYVHIPISQLESRLNEIPKDKLIITA